MKLRIMNDPVLREVCVPVVQSDMAEIVASVPEMIKILENEDGAALAANQVGITKRFFIMRQGNEVRLVVNPEIVEISELKPFQEGCLSIPGAYGPTKRAQQVKLKFKNKEFQDEEMELSGKEAVAVQHEIDHLDGKLYVDQMTGPERMLTLSKHRKFMNSKGRLR